VTTSDDIILVIHIITALNEVRSAAVNKPLGM